MIARLTVGLVPGGLRLNPERLGPGEQLELYELSREACEDGVLSLGRLGKKVRRWERLVERGADRPGIFEKARADETLRAEIAKVVAEATRPPRRIRYEEPGAVVLPRQWIFEWLARPAPVLWLQHIAVLVFVLAQLENGESLAPGSRIEGSGDDATLVLDPSYGLGATLDPQDRFSRWGKDLDHLARNRLLEVERQGREVRIRRGRRVLETAKRRAR
jgi:hypothetical protein